jgi:hypothetical protein
MTAFATTDDLAARLGITLTADEITRAQVLLDIVTGEIEDEADQQISLVTDDVLELPGTTDDRIELPQRPVVSVASVTVDGQPLVEGTDWYLEGDTIIRIATPLTIITGADAVYYDDIRQFPFGIGFGWPKQTIAITYTHGYAADSIPQTLKTICLEATVRAWVNPGSVARETIGNEATVYDNMRFSPTGLLLTTVEVRKIRRLFPRKIGSVKLG